MTFRLSKQTQNPYEALERMLNKTTLSTQRVAHSNIVGKWVEFRSHSFIEKKSLRKSCNTYLPVQYLAKLLQIHCC